MDERDMNELTGLRLDLEPDEVMAVVDALHAYLIKRIGWGLWNRAWRDLEFSIMQELVHNATQAFAKASMILRDLETADPASEVSQMFALTDEMWDFLGLISSATSWDQVERHHVCRCARCANPEKKMKHQNGCQCKLCTDLRPLVS